MTGISRKLPDTERTRLKTILKKIVPEGAGVIVRTAAEGASEEELRPRRRAAARRSGRTSRRRPKAASAPALLYGEPDLTIRVVRDIFNEDFTKLVVVRRRRLGHGRGVRRRTSRRTSPTGCRGGPTSSDVFAAYRIDEQLAKALDRKVWLPSGGSLVIDRTEAMTVVDVNTGKFTGAGGNLEETVTRNNLEAAEEIVRQLRLRDIGGIIVIDFIDMVLESNRDLVLRRLIECLGRDRTKHQVAEVTSLGPGADDPQAGRPGPARGVQRDLRALQRPRLPHPHRAGGEDRRRRWRQRRRPQELPQRPRPRQRVGSRRPATTPVPPGSRPPRRPPSGRGGTGRRGHRDRRRRRSRSRTRSRPPSRRPSVSSPPRRARSSPPPRRPAGAGRPSARSPRCERRDAAGLTRRRPAFVPWTVPPDVRQRRRRPRVPVPGLSRSPSNAESERVRRCTRSSRRWPPAEGCRRRRHRDRPAAGRAGRHRRAARRCCSSTARRSPATRRWPRPP